jgi:hypothetical protein
VSLYPTLADPSPQGGKKTKANRHSVFFYAMLFYKGAGTEVNLVEKGIEQRNARERSGIVECPERAGKAESRQHMPQMKGLKELMLLVSNVRRGGPTGQYQNGAGPEGSSARQQLAGMYRI